jgi:hypothetical protein
VLRSVRVAACYVKANSLKDPAASPRRQVPPRTYLPVTDAIALTCAAAAIALIRQSGSPAPISTRCGRAADALRAAMITAKSAEARAAMLIGETA